MANRGQRLQNRIQLGAVMADLGFTSKLNDGRSTARVLVRDYTLRSRFPDIRTLYQTIMRAVGPSLEQGFLINVNLRFHLGPRRAQYVTIHPNVLDSFETFNARVTQMANPNPGVGSGVLIPDEFDEGFGEEAVLDTRRFSGVFIRNAEDQLRVITAQGRRFQPIGPFGPGAGVWKDKSGKEKGSVWMSHLMERDPTGVLDGFCVRRLSDAFFPDGTGTDWDEADAESRDDWETFCHFVEARGKTVVRVDPTQFYVNHGLLNSIFKKVASELKDNKFDFANEFQMVLVHPTRPSFAVRLMEVVDHHVGPFAEHELPILYQEHHVDAAILDDDRYLAVDPDMWVVMEGSRGENTWGHPETCDVRKLSIRDNAKNPSASFWAGPLTGPVHNRGNGWVYGKEGTTYEKDPPSIHLAETLYVAFDIEAAPDLDDGDNFVPISCSWSWLEEDMFDVPPSEWATQVDRLMESNVSEAKGPDCLNAFLRYLDTQQHRKAVKVVTFNGSRFDHQILLEAVMSTAKQHRLEGHGEGWYPRRLQKSGNKWINFSWNNVELFDLTLHIASSLAKAGKSFALPERWRKIEGGPTHLEIQAIFSKLGPEMWNMAEGEDAQKLDDYLAYGRNDARATILLYRELVLAYRGMGIHKLENTIGRQGYVAFCDTLSETKGELMQELRQTHTKEELKELKICGLLPILDAESEKLERENVVAGAVKLPTGPVSLRGKVIDSLDVTSQYPTSMIKDADGWFGVGKRDRIDWPTVEQCRLDTHVGKFLVDVNQGAMFRTYGHVLFPYKEMGAKVTAMGETRPIGMGNHWNPDKDAFQHPPKPGEGWPEDKFNWWTDGKLTGVLVDNLELKTMLEEGCEVHIRRAWIYRNRVSGPRLFRVMKRWEATKAAMDKLKGTERYNGALREMAKLLLNALSGKMLQGMFTERAELVLDSKLPEKFTEWRAKGWSPSLATYKHGMWVVDVNKLVKHVMDKQYPLEWGKKIYSVSRMRMFKSFYRQAGRHVLYSDTDSGKGERGQLAVARQWMRTNYLPVHPEVLEEFPDYARMPFLPERGKMFGLFEDEHDDMDKDHPENCAGGIVGKKVFAYTDGKIIKISCKGMRPNAMWCNQDQLKELARTNREVREHYNRVQKRWNELPPTASLDEYDTVFGTLSDLEMELRENQEWMRDQYERTDYTTHMRQMDAVRLFQDMAERKRSEAYAVVFWMERAMPKAAKGADMVDVFEGANVISRIVPRYGIKKISVKRAGMGLIFVDGNTQL